MVRTMNNDSQDNLIFPTAPPIDKAGDITSTRPPAPWAPYPAAKKLVTDKSIYIIHIDVVGRIRHPQRTISGRLDRAAYFNSVLSIVATRQRIKPFMLSE